jgi:N-acetylmuramoyl-L-alanine amidase
MTYRAPNWRTLVITAVAALLASALLVLSQPVAMMVDGQRIESDVPPVTTTPDKVFVPLRSIADALGAEINVDERSGRIEVIRGNQTLKFRVGDAKASLNGMPFTLKHPPFRVRGRVMIALHVVASAFDVRVRYDPRTAQIDVMTPGIGQAAEPSSASGQTQ